MTIERPKAISWEAGTGLTPTGPVIFPADLTNWAGADTLLRMIQGSAGRDCGNSWLNLIHDDGVGEGGDDLLVVMCYCYLQGIYHSIDLIRRLDSDENLVPIRGSLGLRPEHIRKFRREHRRSLTDCLTRTLVALWRQRHPGTMNPTETGNRIHQGLNFTLLEPFYLQAQDRIDRAVVADSMALDY